MPTAARAPSAPAIAPPVLPTGEILALLAPLAWSVSVILFKRSSALPALSINLFKNVMATVLLAVTMIVLGIGFPADRSGADWARLLLSGFVGLSVADTLLFEGLRRIGAARLAIVDTIYAPTVVLLSWLFLGDQLSATFLVGAALVIGGVTVANVDPGALTTDDAKELALGTALAATAILCTSVAVVIAKPVLERSDLIEVTWTRLAAGVAGMVIYIVLGGHGREAAQAFRPGPVWWSLVPGAFVGTYLSLLLWLGGYKWADASVAAVLNQMATVYMLGLAAVFLKERVGARQIVGALVAAAGALVVVWGRA